MTGSGKGIGSIWERVNPYPIQNELGKKLIPDDQQRQELTGNLALGTAAVLAPGMMGAGGAGGAGGATTTGAGATGTSAGADPMFNMFKNMAGKYSKRSSQEPYKSKYRMTMGSENY